VAEEEERVMAKIQNRQNFLCILEIERMISTVTLSCTYSNWLEIQVLKACEAKSACTEWFLTLIDMKNFILQCYPGLNVQEVEISR